MDFNLDVQTGSDQVLKTGSGSDYILKPVSDLKKTNPDDSKAVASYLGFQMSYGKYLLNRWDLKYKNWLNILCI